MSVTFRVQLAPWTFGRNLTTIRARVREVLSGWGMKGTRWNPSGLPQGWSVADDLKVRAEESRQGLMRHEVLWQWPEGIENAISAEEKAAVIQWVRETWPNEPRPSEQYMRAAIVGIGLETGDPRIGQFLADFTGMMWERLKGTLCAAQGRSVETGKTFRTWSANTPYKEGYDNARPAGLCTDAPHFQRLVARVADLQNALGPAVDVEAMGRAEWKGQWLDDVGMHVYLRKGVVDITGPRSKKVRELGISSAYGPDWPAHFVGGVGYCIELGADDITLHSPKRADVFPNDPWALQQETEWDGFMAANAAAKKLVPIIVKAA